MTSLSAGAVEGIVNEIVTSDGGDRPVLQVAKFQPVGGANATRHKLWLTDGSRWVYAMAATQVHALLQEGGDFAPGCLVRLLKYSVNDMAGRKIVIVIDLEVAAGPQKLIGAPTGYPNGEALPSDAQPAGGAAPAPQVQKKPAPARGASNAVLAALRGSPAGLTQDALVAKSKMTIMELAPILNTLTQRRQIQLAKGLDGEILFMLTSAKDTENASVCPSCEHTDVEGSQLAQQRCDPAESVQELQYSN